MSAPTPVFWICRSVEMDDAPALARVHIAAWQAAYPGLMPEDYLARLDPAIFRARWEQTIRARRPALLIERASSPRGETAKAVVGFAIFGASRDPGAAPSTGELIAINLDPAYWRCGLGKVLLTACVSRLRAAGFSEANLWVLRANERARCFYEAQGWSEDGTEKYQRIGDAAEVLEVRYQRSLEDRNAPHDRRARPRIAGDETLLENGRGQSDSASSEHESNAREAAESLAIGQESPTTLSEYESIPIAFEVNDIFEVSSHGTGFLLQERSVDPWVKDYDGIDGERPTQWATQFDVASWRVVTARRDGRLVGGAVLAWNSPGVEMLEGRTDLAVLWDIRILPEERRKGVGTLLFRAAEEWAIAHGCKELKVETQNTNVGACRFYARQGCVLGEVNRFAYPVVPDDVQLIWLKNLLRAQ